MIQKIVLAVAVFVVILVALTFGESIGREALEWLTHITGLVFHNFADVFDAVRLYVNQNLNKIVIALVLTVPIVWWLIRNKGEELNRKASRRKVAIVLAIFLGWLGAHRFYLGQIGWGILFLIIFWVFAPLAVAIALIDAVRYFFTPEEDFLTLYNR